MKIIELILDEDALETGVHAISIVAQPAIESDFIALNKHREINFTQVSKEKKILLGAALIPNKTIFRKREDEGFYVYFSADTIRKASELFLKNGSQGESTLEHQMKLKGLTVVESWIVDDPEKDKSAVYNLNVPSGTWMVSVKVDNDEIWNDYVKTGKVNGFSIEGYFADKTELTKVENIPTLEDLWAAEQEHFKTQVKALFDKETLPAIKLESYADYPDAVSNNAKRGIELNEKINNKCATQVGKVRAQQLAQKQGLTIETIKRMYSYLSRSETYYDEADSKSYGTISYLLWGGLDGKRWAESKLKELGEIDG
jgi:hypothetical protein